MNGVTVKFQFDIGDTVVSDLLHTTATVDSCAYSRAGKAYWLSYMDGNGKVCEVYMYEDQLSPA